MTISVEIVLTVIGGASALSTAIYWGAYHLGRYRQRMDALELELKEHCNDFGIHVDRRYHKA